MRKEVGIIRANVDDLDASVHELMNLIGYRPSSRKVLLKPNIVVAARPENGDITHPALVEALVTYFRNRGSQVVVAEGTGIFSTRREFERLLETTGYGDLSDRLDVPVINLEQAERERIPWTFGSLRLPKLLRECDYINLPTMKTHLQTTVSIGVKNQKGLIPMETKRIFHKRDLHASILELSNVVRPSLTVVDAIFCIEGTGPTGPPVGEVKRMDLLTAGTDMMAVDNVCARIMGFEPAHIKHLRTVEDIRTRGLSVDSVRTPFKRPGDSFSRDHFTVHMDERACTMCTVSFYKAFSKIVNTPELRLEMNSRKDLAEIHLILGPTEPPSESAGCVLCIGDCAAKTAKQYGLSHVAGCHPDYREVVNHLFPGTYPSAERGTGAEPSANRPVTSLNQGEVDNS